MSWNQAVLELKISSDGQTGMTSVKCPVQSLNVIR